MPVSVLLADHDLDVHKLVADLLPILFKDVALDRVLKMEDVLEKLSAPEASYNLIILDLEVEGLAGRNVLNAIREQFPHMLGRTVLILDSADAQPDDGFESVPRIVKPFSLDEFGEIVKKARAD